jgi:hypothetical protein
MKKYIRLPKSEYNVVAWCREPIHFFVEPFFFLGSNKSIPPPRSLFQQKVIAKIIAKVIYFNDQKRKKKKYKTKKNKRKMEGPRKRIKRRKND